MIDDFKTKQQVAEEIIGAEDIIDYSAKPNIGDLLSGGFSKVSLSTDSSKLIKQLLVESNYSNGYQLK